MDVSHLNSKITDAEIWTSYNFHRSQNILLFFSPLTYIKMQKLFWGFIQNKPWPRFSPRAIVCGPLVKSTWAATAFIISSTKNFLFTDRRAISLSPPPALPPPSLVLSSPSIHNPSVRGNLIVLPPPCSFLPCDPGPAGLPGNSRFFHLLGSPHFYPVPVLES